MENCCFIGPGCWASLKRGQWEIAVCRKLTEVDWIKEATTAAWNYKRVFYSVHVCGTHSTTCTHVDAQSRALALSMCTCIFF